MCVLVATKFVSEKQAPVATRALSFQILGITALDFGHKRRQRRSWRTGGLQCSSLLLKFRAHDSRPQSLVCGQGGGNLRVESAPLLEV